MKEIQSENLRNVAVVGHGHSGKTSLVSAMLYNTKMVNRLGTPRGIRVQRIRRKTQSGNMHALGGQFPFDFRRAGSFGAGVMEQRGAGFVGEVAEVHTEHAAPRRTFATLEVGEIGERFACRHQTQAIGDCRRAI